MGVLLYIDEGTKEDGSTWAHGGFEILFLGSEEIEGEPGATCGADECNPGGIDAEDAGVFMEPFYG